jgi:hypothetical protein
MRLGSLCPIQVTATEPDRQRFVLSPRERQRVAEAFFAASRSGDVSAL